MQIRRYLIQEPPKKKLWFPKHPKCCVCLDCAYKRANQITSSSSPVIGFSTYETLGIGIINPRAVTKVSK